MKISLPPATGGQPVWLHVGTLLDGTSTAPRRDAHIVYDAKSIRFVDDAGRMPPQNLLRAEQTRPDVTASDATLLPGLIEAHAHLFLEGGELDAAKRSSHLKRPEADLLADAKARLPRLVRWGVTAVRDAGDRNGVGLALSRLYRSAERPLMPYLDSPGAAIHHKGRYGSFMGEPLENFPTLRECVAARVSAGADRIKLIPTGIIDFKQGRVTTEPQMTEAELVELATAARFFERQTFAHASGDTGIDRVIAAGIDSVEHGFFIRDDQLARMRDARIAWVPTFAPVQRQVDHAAVMRWDATIVANLQRILDGHAASLRRAHELGVLIIAGSDAGSYGVAHGDGFIHELELMERAGLPPLAVINAATGTSAGRLGYHENFGRIAPGALSRFIVTAHSPLAGISNLRRARTVVFDGVPHVADQTEPVQGL